MRKKHHINNIAPPLQFHALTTMADGMSNRVITDVHLTPAFDPNKYKDGQIPFELIQKNALWDTGATNSVITAATAQEMKLTPIGVVNVVHYGGVKQSNTYMVNMFLPNRVAITGVIVSESGDIVGKGFDVIFGMDIITRGDFSITNVNNQTCMSFRFPSIATIDYVWEAERIRYLGADKYGPCPCGSKDEHGKPIKYKFCHGIAL
jgi:hypothetical protein